VFTCPDHRSPLVMVLFYSRGGQFKRLWGEIARECCNRSVAHVLALLVYAVYASIIIFTFIYIYICIYIHTGVVSRGRNDCMRDNSKPDGTGENSARLPRGAHTTVPVRSRTRRVAAVRGAPEKLTPPIPFIFATPSRQRQHLRFSAYIYLHTYECTHKQPPTHVYIIYIYIYTQQLYNMSYRLSLFFPRHTLTGLVQVHKL